MGIFYLTSCIRKNVEPEIYMFNPTVDFSTATFDIKVIEPEEILIKEIYLNLYKENELETTRSSKDGIHKVGTTEDITFDLLSPSTEYRIDFSFDYVFGDYIEKDAVIYSYSFKTLENTTGVSGKISNWLLINDVLKFDAIFLDENYIIDELNIYLKLDDEIITVLDKTTGFLHTGQNNICRFESLLPKSDYSVLLCASFTYEDKVYKDLLLDKKEFKTNNYSFLPYASFSNVQLKEDVITFDLTIHDNYHTLTKLLVLITDSKDNVLSKLSMDDGLILGRNKDQSFTGLWSNSTYTLSVVADYQTPVEKIRNEIIAEEIIKTDSFSATPQASITNISTSGARVTFSYEIQDRYKMLTDLSIVLLSIEAKDTYPLYTDDDVIMKLTKEDGVAVGMHNATFDGLAPNTDYMIVILASYNDGQEEKNKEIIANQLIHTNSYTYPNASIDDYYKVNNDNVTFYYKIQDEGNLLTDISIRVLDMEDNLVTELTKEDGVTVGGVGDHKGEFKLLPPNSNYKIVIFGIYNLEKEKIEQVLATKEITTEDYPYFPTVSVSNIIQDIDSISFDYQIVDEYAFLTALKCNILSRNADLLRTIDLSSNMANSHYTMTIDGIVAQTFAIQFIASYRYLNLEEKDVVLDTFVYEVNPKEDFEYDITDTGVVITKYIGQSKNCIIPQMIDGIEVTSIGNYAFEDNKSIKRIAIPDSVNSIGMRAFESCINLISVNIPNGVTSIGYEAFYRCNSLESIIIPKGITDMGVQAFAQCNKLRYVYYEGTIDSWCELQCQVFNQDWDQAYSHHFYIRNSNNLWEEVTSIEIPNTLTEIVNYQFCGFDNLESITIPNSVKSIGISSFFDCRSLKEIVIPNSVTSLSSNAFSKCSSLETVIFPKALTDVGYDTFLGCGNLKKVFYEGTIENWCRMKFGTITSNPMRYASDFYLRNHNGVWEKVTSIVIPNTITEIGDFQFHNFENLTSVSIPNSVKTIGKYAFLGCRDLTSVFIPRNVTNVGERAFAECGYNNSMGFVINCEIASKPSGWNSQWLGSGDNSRIIVNWGYIQEE